MSIILNSKQLHYILSGSFTGSFFGNLNGTASYSETASYIANIDTVFVKNQTNNLSSNTVKQYQNIFNHDNLIVNYGDTLLIESDAEYFILGNLTNSGSVVVSGSLIVNGAILNAGSIEGPGVILSNNKILTYDKANIPYGFPQLDNTGN